MTPLADVPVLGAEDVAALVPYLDVGVELRRVFAGLGVGDSIQPPQTVIDLGDGADAILYPAASRSSGVFSVKLSPYLPARVPSVTAWTLLVSTETGAPVLLCDSAGLTTERTAATTALAVDLLAPDGARTLAVIGSGPIAAAHLRHVLPLRPFSDVRVHSPSIARGDQTSLRRMSEAGPGASFSSTVVEAASEADVVLLCTSSATPVLETCSTAADALITSISTNKPRAHEIPPDDLSTLAVYCDYRSAAPLSAGEMVIAQEQQAWSSEDIVADLAELVSNAAPPRPVGRAFFRSIGLGIEDVAVAVAVLRAWRERR